MEQSNCSFSRIAQENKAPATNVGANVRIDLALNGKISQWQVCEEEKNHTKLNRIRAVDYVALTRAHSCTES